MYVKIICLNLDFEIPVQTSSGSIKKQKNGTLTVPQAKLVSFAATSDTTG